MAFIFDNFQTHGGSAGGLQGAPKLHTYKTDDAVTVVDNAGYFNDAYLHVSIGDLVYVCVVTDLGVAAEAVADAGFFVVNAVTKGAVDVSDITNITVTDSGG
jgi:hypothetical protein